MSNIFSDKHVCLLVEQWFFLPRTHFLSFLTHTHTHTRNQHVFQAWRRSFVLDEQHLLSFSMPKLIVLDSICCLVSVVWLHIQLSRVLSRAQPSVKLEVKFVWWENVFSSLCSNRKYPIRLIGFPISVALYVKSVFPKKSFKISIFQLLSLVSTNVRPTLMCLFWCFRKS